MVSNLLTLLSSRFTIYFGHRTSLLNVSTDVAVSFLSVLNRLVHFHERANSKTKAMDSLVGSRPEIFNASKNDQLLNRYSISS